MSSKGFVRLTVIGTTVYLLLAFIVAQYWGNNIFTSFYVIFFEWCVVMYCFSEGKYHCKYMKFTALGVAAADTLSRLDYVFNFLTVTAHNLIPVGMLVTCVAISFYKAIQHFIRVRRIRKLRQHGEETP